MIGLCEFCAYKQSDCKGNKDLEKLKCEYYKKRPVQNVKQMAERIAELEIKLKDSAEVVRCKDCRHAEHRKQMQNQVYCKRDKLSTFCAVHDEDDFCKYGERKEE